MINANLVDGEIVPIDPNYPTGIDFESIGVE